MPPLRGQFVGPPAYVRRHLAEHAYAGGILNEDVLPPQFLPYIDLPRLRELTTNWEASDELATSCRPSLPLLPVLRQISHLWDFERPTANAGALQMWAASAGHPAFDPGQPVPWRALWARWSTGPGEILSRHAGSVEAVATAVLPDRRPIAVTGSHDATVRIWDLHRMTAVQEPLHLPGVVAALATLHLPTGIHLAVTGPASSPSSPRPHRRPVTCTAESPPTPADHIRIKIRVGRANTRTEATGAASLPPGMRLSEEAAPLVRPSPRRTGRTLPAAGSRSARRLERRGHAGDAAADRPGAAHAVLTVNLKNTVVTLWSPVNGTRRVPSP